jgi:DNA-binding transcriptional ArsR family regulator
MPVLDTTAVATPVFDVSTALDLFWALMEAGAERRPSTRERDVHLAPLLDDTRLVKRVIAFWDEGPDDFSELLVLAATGGVLTGALEGGAVISAITGACEHVPLDAPLRSETEAARAVILRRLAKLSGHRPTRRRYAALLGDVWGAVEEDWRRRGLPAAEQAVARCRERQERGEPWAGLLEKSDHLERNLADSFARADGSPVFVVISAYGRSLVLDLPPAQLIGLRVRGDAADARERNTELARRLRALSDPTRLAILELLARTPSSVGEIALQLAVAQPTVSNHMKLLREAGLVRLDRNDGRQQLAVDVSSLQALLEEVAGRLGAVRPGQLGDAGSG